MRRRRQGIPPERARQWGDGTATEFGRASQVDRQALEAFERPSPTVKCNCGSAPPHRPLSRLSLAGGGRYFPFGSRVSVPDWLTFRISSVTVSATRSGPTRNVTPLGPAAISP